MVLVARKDLQANTLPEFIQLLKANGDKMQYGSAGAGSTTHLGCALVTSRIGAKVAHVAYRGGGPAMNDLLGGQLDYFCGNLGGYVPLVQAKQVKAIALLSRERSALMPELATAHEQGLTDLDVVTWTAFFLPKGAPKEVVDRLIAITHAAMDTPAIKDRMLQIGVTGVAPARRSPEYLAKFVADEIVRWEGPIKAAGLQVE
jgi:tripartite-type tricarboxylate transporter receptor subunit TctC